MLCFLKECQAELDLQAFPNRVWERGKVFHERLVILLYYIFIF